MNGSFARLSALLWRFVTFWGGENDHDFLKGFLPRKRWHRCVVSVLCAGVSLLLSRPVCAQPRPESVLARGQQTALPEAAPPLFPRIRALDLERCRQLSLQRSANVALAGARVGQAQAERREAERRIVLQAQGGFDPVAGKVRYYLNLDLERLLALNKQQRRAARQAEAAQVIGQTSAQQEAVARASRAWYGMVQAQAAVLGAGRARESARALYVAADARFRAGQGELSGVLSALRGDAESDDSYERARQGVALACLELAQACGYLTAEEMEAAL